MTSRVYKSMKAHEIRHGKFPFNQDRRVFRKVSRKIARKTLNKHKTQVVSDCFMMESMGEMMFMFGLPDPMTKKQRKVNRIILNHIESGGIKHPPLVHVRCRSEIAPVLPSVFTGEVLTGRGSD